MVHDPLADLLPQGFYPNYLGVYVLYAIGVAMLATVASSLYPIRVAAQLVNPSLERSWKIDTAARGRPPGGSPAVHRHQPGRDPGMLTYAYEFLAVHQGERSGQFVCQTPAAAGHRRRPLGVQMDVWLAPFERNITQDVRLAGAARRPPGAVGLLPCTSIGSAGRSICGCGAIARSSTPSASTC